VKGENSLKISVCCTVKNEEASIKEFLESMLNQSRLPDEIIIVDGGSKDRTVNIIQAYQKCYSGLIRLILAPGANIAKGRNIGIKEAKYDYIASADAGTEYDRNWLRNLSEKFEKEPDADIVSGFFKAKTENLYEECVGMLLYPNPDIMKWDKFLPSARSVAFKKKVWKDLGGYAEWLPRGIGEDSHFFLRALNKGYKFAHAKNAVCYWRPRSNLIKLFKQYFLYSRSAVVGGFSKTFLFQAYGNNPVFFTFKNFVRYLQERKILHLVLSILILTTVISAKISGTIIGMMQKAIFAYKLEGVEK